MDQAALPRASRPTTSPPTQLVDEMNQALRIPGVSNAWTMPIKNRIDMLTTGVRTPVGVKIFGAGPRADRAASARRSKACCRSVPGTRSVFAERVGGGYFLDFDLKRDQLARYGLSVDDAQAVVMNAIGGDNVSTAIEGRERYPINVRYYRDSRSSIDRLGRALVPAMDGKMQIPLAEIATLKMATGPSMLRNENGMLNGYVYVDVAGRDIGGYVAEAKRVVRDRVALPPGYTLAWSGQYEAMERVRERLKMVLPLTLFLIFVLLYLNTRSAAKTMLILLAVPFSAVGAIWLLYAPGLQHEHRRVGGAHRADGRGRRNRRLHAAVSRPGLRRAPACRRACAARRTCGRPSFTAPSSASARSS